MELHLPKTKIASTISSADCALTHSELLSCFGSVVQDVIVPHVVERCDDPIRFQFQSELIRQLAMCCARQTLSSLEHSDELSLCDLISLLSKGLFSLRICRNVCSI
jgi:hypothetical protein